MQTKTQNGALWNMGALFLILISLFFSGCATLPPSQVGLPTQGVYHIVGGGQTLYRISKTYGVDINTLMRANNITDSNQIGVGQQIFIPGAGALHSVEPFRPQNLESIENLAAKKYSRIHWHYLTIHHSATLEGCAESFDRNHRSRHMGGLFYHFVIGNGHGSSDGEIEVGWRWARQVEVNRKQDIQICLVGDFNRQEPTSAQIDSLAKLVRVLQKQYSISAHNVRRHKDIPGKATECPGKYISVDEVLSKAR